MRINRLDVIDDFDNKKLCIDNWNTKEGWKIKERREKFKLFRIRESFLKCKYGITSDIFADMLKSQNFCCAICNKRQEEDKFLCVDHNHETGEVRGLLCCSCNSAIGLLKENTESLKKAISYLEMPRQAH